MDINNYREQLLKAKVLNDRYKAEREKEGDINVKSPEQQKDQSMIKRLEKKPDRLPDEAEDDYNARIAQWEARVGVKAKEEMASERDKLVKNFQRIMSPSEASEMMTYPQITDDNIKKLNQHWRSFEEELRKKYSSLDFDILQEFILKYIDTVENGDNLTQEIKRGFLVMRDRLDEITVGLEEKTEALEEVINSTANRNNRSLFRVHNLLAALIRNKANLTEQQIQQQSAQILTAISDASENVDNKTQRVLDGIESAVNTINDSIASSENAVKGSIKASERRIKSSIGRSVQKLITELNESNDRISFELQTRLGQMMMALQQNNIDLVNQKTREIEQTINQAQRLSSQEVSNATRALLEQTKTLIGKVRNDINNNSLALNALQGDVTQIKNGIVTLTRGQQNIINDITTTNENLSTLQRNILSQLAQNQLALNETNIQLIAGIAQTNNRLTEAQEDLLRSIIESRDVVRQDFDYRLSPIENKIKSVVSQQSDLLDEIRTQRNNPLVETVSYEANAPRVIREIANNPNIPQEDRERLTQNVRQTGLFSPDRENPLLQQLSGLQERTRERRERKKQRQEQEALKQEVDDEQPISSSSGRKMTEYRDEVVRASLKKQDFQNIKQKIYSPTARMEISLLARDYASEILAGKEGEEWLKEFNTNVAEKVILGKDITNETIKEYIAPLIAYARNNYIIKHNLTGSNRTSNPAIDYSKDMLGAGLKQKNIQFGRYELDRDKLDKRNLLITLHHTSLNRVKYFPQKIVSDELKDLIYYVSTKNKYNEKMFKLLDDEEKLLFKNMFVKSGLSKMLNVAIFDDASKQAKKDFNDLKEKYYVIDGEIGAGNDNPQLLKELNNVVKALKKQIVYMNKIGLMGLKEANNLILSL